MAISESKTKVEEFIALEAHLPGYLERVMLSEDPVMAQFRLSGGLDGMRRNQLLRDRVVEQFGYAVLTQEALDRLIPYGPFLEVGAGLGYWAYELQRAGAICIATDMHTPETKATPDVHHPFQGRECYVNVIAMDAQEAANKHPDKTPLMVWPELGLNWAYTALLEYEGATLVYVGEERGGWTGDDQLHDEIERCWTLEERIKIPCFPCHSDAIFVYKRTER